MEIKFYCQICGSKLSAEESMIGDSFDCPSCNNEINVPVPVSQLNDKFVTQVADNNRFLEENHTPKLRTPQELRKSQKKENSSNSTYNQQKIKTSKKINKNKISGILKSPIYNKRNNNSKKSSHIGLFAIIAGVGLIGGIILYFIFDEHKEMKALPQFKKAKNLAQQIQKTEKAPVKSIIPDEEREKISESPQFTIIKEKVINDSNCGVRKVIFGEFVINANLNLNENVKVSFSIPLNANGKPVENASNVVYHCPYMPEKNFFSRPHHRRWSEEAGYTFFSMDIVSREKDIYSREKIYYYPESGFHDLVFKCKKIIEQHYGLKERKILLTGESSGGIMAKEFIIYYPDKISGAAYVGGHNNIVHTSKVDASEASVGCLIIHTCGDNYQRPVFDRYFQVLRMATAPRWEKKGEKHYHHAGGPMSWEYIHLFLKGVVELRSKHGGELPYFRDWPYVQNVKEWDNKYYSPIRKIRKQYFPTKEFKDAWNLVPHNALNELHYNYRRNGHSDKTLKFHKLKRFFIKKNIFFIPKDVTPESIVIYIHDPAEDHNGSDVTQMDCLYYLMENAKVVGCSVKISDDNKESLKRVIKLLQEVKNKNEWKDLPIYICGLGIGGKLVAIAALRHGDDIEKKKIEIKSGKVKITKTKIIRHERVKKIVTINSDYSKIKSINPLVKARGKSKIPLVMLYSSKFNKLKPKNIPKFTKVKNSGTSGYTLDKKWFPILKKIALGEVLEF